MTQPSMPPDVVIRPSGIWNSRAPFHNFLQEHRWANRTFGILTMAACRLTYEVGQAGNQDRGAKGFMKVSKSGQTSQKAWLNFKLSFPLDNDGQRPEPKVTEVSDSLRYAHYALREAAIQNYLSFFETFVQSWVLNFLLAKLECGKKEWTTEERDVAVAMSPIHRTKSTPPWPWIMDKLVFLKEELSRLPHIFTHPDSGQEAVVPVSAELNAYTTMRFWRRFRNLTVHCGGVVSLGFHKRHSAFFEKLRGPYSKHMGPLAVGQRVQFYDDVFRAVVTTHYKAALHMNEILERVSEGHRGHLFAPGPKPYSFVLSGSERVPSLLVEGDHSPSLEWVKNFAKNAEVGKAEALEVEEV